MVMPLHKRIGSVLALSMRTAHVFFDGTVSVRATIAPVRENRVFAGSTRQGTLLGLPRPSSLPASCSSCPGFIVTE